MQEGWFLWSTYVQPSDMNMQSVINPIVDNTVIVKNWQGSVYWPSLNINTIGDLVSGQGYQIKSEQATVLDIEGDLIPYDYTINMPQGWFLLGYLNQSAADAPVMMEPIVDYITIIKDWQGNVYWPMLNINTLGFMQPGQGYQIKTSLSTALNYPYSGSGRFDFNNSHDYVSTKYNKPINTGNNMTLGIPEDAWENKPDIGDEIAIYSQDGLLVGHAVCNTGATAISIWGDDLLTAEKDGLDVNEEFNIKLWRKSLDTEEIVDVNLWKEGSQSYSVDGISIAGSVVQSQHVERQLIKIVDLIGREVDSNTQKINLLYIYDDGSIETKIIF